MVEISLALFPIFQIEQRRVLTDNNFEEKSTKHSFAIEPAFILELKNEKISLSNLT